MDHFSSRGSHFDFSEHDACALIARVKKNAKPSHGNVKRTLESLSHMSHRAGEIDGEGDGAGIQTDVPREIWARHLERRGLRGSAAHDAYFTVAHILLPKEHEAQWPEIQRRALAVIREGGLEVILEKPADVSRSALGPLALAQEPQYWQVACLPGRQPGGGAPRASGRSRARPVQGVARGSAPFACRAAGGGSPLGAGRAEDRDTFRIHTRLEAELPLSVVSFSKNSVIYKVRGSCEALARYFPELRDPEFKSAIALAHARYSTNTLSRAERAQMFSTLGHNGEINTIDKLTREALALGFQVPLDGSDSQILDRIVENFMFRYDLSLMETLEILFPPVWSEIELYPAEIQEYYRYYRRAWGSLAQGPAALICRQGDEIVFSSDAMGLRPLWFGETEMEYFASSERGVITFREMASDPGPLAPGEKMALRVRRGEGVEVFEYPSLQREVLREASRRIDLARANGHVALPAPVVGSTNGSAAEREVSQAFFLASGWRQSDISDLKDMAETAKEPFSGLGFDGPLAALSDDFKNVADFLKEKVAVVTNPSIDGVRESAHFSQVVFLGRRPGIAHTGEPAVQVRLRTPLLMGGCPGPEDSVHARVARKLGTCLLEDLTSDGRGFGLRVERLDLSYDPVVSSAEAIEALRRRAVEAVRAGFDVLVLTDEAGFEARRPMVDAHVAVAAVDNALRDVFVDGESLRRRCSLVLHSAWLRNIHDLMVALGLGADALCPYAAWLVVTRAAAREAEKDGADIAERKHAALLKAAKTLMSGIEKVISTMGTHEIEGYGRIFAAIGLADDLAETLNIPNYCGNREQGLTLAGLDAEARERAAVLDSPKPPSLPKDLKFNARVFPLVNKVGRGEMSYEDYTSAVKGMEIKTPVCLRHLLDIMGAENPLDAPGEIATGLHSAPIFFASMSFGSQGETSFRAYANAARRLNIVCINGEGGELEELMDRLYYNRGQQVASARFGVNIRMLNSSHIIEIKIGQGAKPGEGGHLPAFKVTELIAKTRHTPQKIDLISPANNHDIYSIEDLAQVIEEIKTANPHARVSVKIPSVPAIGPIAAGIAKARADIVAISGYDGGTGAARKHSTQYVGMPVETGVREAHLALCREGLRDKVEVWCDGGMRTAEDVMKMILMGANRVGFGSVAMFAIGCTTCRHCNRGDCHVGITSQIPSVEAAKALGVKSFTPRVYDQAVEDLVGFFSPLCEELRKMTARLGASHIQDLVGRCDLLRQVRGLDRVDLGLLTERKGEDNGSSVRAAADRRALARRSRTSLSKTISNVVLQSIRESGEELVIYDDHEVSNTDRALGTYLAGRLTRARKLNEDLGAYRKAILNFHGGVIGGNGLGAYTTEGLDIRVEGGAQDGAAKSANGGRVAIFKGENEEGLRLDGSVGKCFAYGAQGGTLIVQGNADSRAGIRLSGADVIIGGRVREPLRDELGCLAARANIKGFAFEYMTSGRGLVLGDPGPWMAAGMTGGVVYFLLDESVGLTAEALQRRLAPGASVILQAVSGSQDEGDIRELLSAYIEVLEESGQEEETAWVRDLMAHWSERFLKAAVPAPVPLAVVQPTEAAQPAAVPA